MPRRSPLLLSLLLLGAAASCRFNAAGAPRLADSSRADSPLADAPMTDTPAVLPLPDLGADLRARIDGQRPPDSRPPDSRPPDGLPVDSDGDGIPDDLDPRPQTADTVLYLAAKLGAAAGEQLTVPKASWGPQGDLFCHTSSGNKVEWTLLQKSLPADQLVETVVEVTGVVPGWPHVGLLFRLTTPANKLNAYVCGIDLALGSLIIGRFWNGGYYGDYGASAAGSIPTSPWPRTYRLRASAKGSALSCELVGGGPALTEQQTLFSSGTVGLAAIDANACFKSLVVVAP
jgi:hypothetical protein